MMNVSDSEKLPLHRERTREDPSCLYNNRVQVNRKSLFLKCEMLNPTTSAHGCSGVGCNFCNFIDSSLVDVEMNLMLCAKTLTSV